MYNSFIEALPDKVRSSSDLEYGCRFRKKDKALEHRYVELPQLYKKFIALDLDIPGSAYLWDLRGLPPPTYIVINPKNAHCHYLYELKTPVYYTEASRRAPQKYFEATDIALTNLLGADLGFVGHLVKNPLHPHWHTICHRVTYDLEDFKEWGIDLRGHKLKQVLRESLDGRNTTLFDTLRHWAYVEVRTAPSYADFQQGVDNKAQSFNGMFIDCKKGVLPIKEVLSTAKSVGAWTWRHKDSIGNQKNRGVMELSSDMSLGAKQAAGAGYTHELRKQSNKVAIIQAAIALKAVGTPITQESVRIRADVTLSAVRTYWNEVDQAVGLYKKMA
jgi:Replicase family/Primase C terminal 1 (PriCT-1)